MRAWSVSNRLRELIRAVSGSAGIAIENHQLLQAQKELMNALIKLIAGAIDAKSAYTGGHCQRVPVLTRMLAEAACAQKDGPFQQFQLSEEEWEAVDIGSWLHDCGKVTTPEYVVDKATKLETIYDRIHEVRMRFEVLKRDVEIGYWQAVAKGGDPDALRERMEAELRALDEDFAFVASCNEGGEFMDPARIERLKRIAARTWRRTLDDRLGTSYEERARKDRTRGAEPAGRRAAAGRPRGSHHPARAARDDRQGKCLGHPGRDAAAQDQSRRALQPHDRARHPDGGGALHHQRPHDPDHHDAGKPAAAAPSARPCRRSPAGIMRR